MKINRYINEEKTDWNYIVSENYDNPTIISILRDVNERIEVRNY